MKHLKILQGNQNYLEKNMEIFIGKLANPFILAQLKFSP